MIYNNNNELININVKYTVIQTNNNNGLSPNSAVGQNRVIITIAR